MTTDGDGTTAGEVDKLLARIKERGFQSVDELLADRDHIAEDRDKVKEHNDKAQKIIQRQGAELGELRKKVGAPDPAGTGGDEQPGDGSEAVKPLKPAKQEASVEELEASLTDEQRAVADTVYQNASEEEKIKFVEDPEARKKLLGMAKETIRSVPKTLWDRPSRKASAQGSDDSRIKQLFEQAKKQIGYMPPGSSKSAPGAIPDGQTTEPIRRVGTGGVLERIERERQRPK